METTYKNRKVGRRPAGRLQPVFDRLEARLALSTSTVGSAFGSVSPIGSASQAGSLAVGRALSVVSTNPATSATLATSPLALTVSFDRPLDSFSLGNDDFRLVHVAADGSTTPLAVGEAKLVEALDTSDPTGERISLGLSKPLVDGHYRIILVGGNQVRGDDQASVSGGGSDQNLADFTVGTPGSGLAGAADLGTIGSTETVVPGSLNLAGDPGAVEYRKLTLAPGHHWRLGLEVSAHRDGGMLSTTLSLFDAQGHLIKTTSQGTADDPEDPYLFAGLDPGTYYVGISAQLNVPDASGVYDPSQTIVNSQGSGQAGGPFRLHVVADVADQPTQVLGLRVDHDDPRSTVPTGLTIHFAGPIDPTGLADPSHPALSLVDQDGRSWPVSTSDYDATTAKLSILFDEGLAPGTYRLELAEGGGLVDLAGMSPIAQGSPAGVLGSFDVVASRSAVGDLGPLYPTSVDSGISATIHVGTSAPTVESFVALVPGVYVLGGVGASSGISFSVLDAKSNEIAVGPGTSEGGAVEVVLKPGPYTLVFTNAGTGAADVSLTIRRKQNLLASLLDGGVAQGPAFNLRLVTPQAIFGGTDAPSSSSSASTVSIVSDSGTGRDSGSTSTSASPAATASANGPSGSGIIYVGVPVGRPSSQANQISAVGPSASSNSVAIASNEAGLPGGLIAIPVSISPGTRPEPDAVPLDSEIAAEGSGTLRRVSTLEAGLLGRTSASRRGDERSLDGADWIDRVVTSAFAWIGDIGDEGPGLAAGPERAADSSTMVAVAVAGPVSNLTAAADEESSVEGASLASPIGIGVLAMIAFRYRRNVLGPARNRVGAVAKVRPILVGPHRRSRVMVVR